MIFMLLYEYNIQVSLYINYFFLKKNRVVKRIPRKSCPDVSLTPSVRQNGLIPRAPAVSRTSALFAFVADTPQLASAKYLYQNLLQASLQGELITITYICAH